MSEASPSPAADEAAPVVPLRLLAQFIKDLSFEVPSGAEIFGALRDNAPEIPTALDMGMRHLGGSTYEVTLSAHIEAFVAGKTAFILEAEYAAVVELNEQVIPQEHIHPLLLLEVPRQLFPFMRQLVSTVTVNGGFPPLMLQLVDFGELYRKKFGIAELKSSPPPAVDTSIH